MTIFCPKAPADPFATTPGALIGYGKRGPIYLLGGAAPDGEGEGEGGEGSETGSGGAGTEGTGGAGEAGGEKPAGRTRRRSTSTSGGEGDGSAGESGEGQPAGGEDTTKLQRALDSEREARKAAERKARTKEEEATAAAAEAARQHQETLDGIAKALGFKKDDAPPDPAQLERTLAEQGTKVAALEGDIAARDNTIRGLQVELAAFRAATTAGVNPVALLDSRSFVDSVIGLDPAGDAFQKDLAAAVTAASKANPALLINQAASAADAGIGTAGSRGTDPAHVTPGASRLRAAYENN